MTTTLEPIEQRPDEPETGWGEEYSRTYHQNYETHPWAHPRYKPHMTQRELTRLTAAERKALAARPIVFRMAKGATMTPDAIEQGPYMAHTKYRKGEQVIIPCYRHPWAEEEPERFPLAALKAASIIPLAFREDPTT